MEHISVKKKTDRLIITHKIEKNEQINYAESEIINQEKIPALLPVQIRRSMLGKEIRVVVGNHTDLRSFLKNNISFGMFVQIVLQIVDAIHSCESYGICCGNLELSSDLAFYNHANQQVLLICWPLISLTTSSDISSFFMELGGIYIGRGHDSDYRLCYLQFFDSRVKFDLECFKQHLEILLERWQAKQSGVPSAPEDNVVSRKPVDIPHTVGLWTSSLQRVSTQTTIHVSRYPFTIGRKAEFCDYAIEDNPYVSKRHVTVLLRNGQAYIRDNGSANGTFLNGTRLPAHTDVKLQSGDCFRVGNEDFIFYSAGD